MSFINRYFGYNYETNVSGNPDVQKSIEYLNNAPEDIEEIIENYRAEAYNAFDPTQDDYEEYRISWENIRNIDGNPNPNILEYTLINWILYGASENIFQEPHNALKNNLNNSNIRRDELCTMIHNVFKLNNFLKTYPIISNPQGITLYRGLKKNSKKIFNVKIGNTFNVTGIMSTSLSPESAYRFASNYFLKINVPQGTQLPVVNDMSDPNSELEVLLPFVSTFRVDSNTPIEINGRNIRLLEVTFVAFSEPIYSADVYCTLVARFFDRPKGEMIRSNRLKEKEAIKSHLAIKSHRKIKTQATIKPHRRLMLRSGKKITMKFGGNRKTKRPYNKRSYRVSKKYTRKQKNKSRFGGSLLL